MSIKHPKVDQQKQHKFYNKLQVKQKHLTLFIKPLITRIPPSKKLFQKLNNYLKEPSIKQYFNHKM